MGILSLHRKPRNKKEKFEGKNHKKAGWKNLKGKTPGEQVAVTKPTEKGGKTAQPANRPTGVSFALDPTGLVIVPSMKSFQPWS